PSDHTGKAHGGEELLLRTPRPIRRQLKSVTNLVLGVIKDQRQPTFTSAVMEAIAGGSKGREQMLFVLLGATGMRIGEALGLEIDRHISSDFSTLHIRQKAWRGQIQLFLKSENGIRDIDLSASIAAMLREFSGDRTSGLLFCSKNGY